VTAVSTEIRRFVESKHPGADLTDSDDIVARGYLTSLFAMQIVLFLEQRFGIRIPNEDLRPDTLRSFAAMADLVERRQRAVAP